MLPILVEMRKMQLFTFMQSVVSHPFLYTSEEYQQFLRGGGDYKRCAAALPPATSRRVLFRYERYFGRPESDDEESLDARIRHFEREFEWQLEALREIRDKTKDLMESYFEFRRNLMGFAENVKEIEPFLRQEDGEMDFWFEYPAKTCENPYLRLHSWFVMEKQECSAIYHTIKARNILITRRKAAISEKDTCERKLQGLCEGKMVLPWQSRNRLKVKYEERVDTVRTK